jgi:hypothetical protein
MLNIGSLRVSQWSQNTAYDVEVGVCSVQPYVVGAQLARNNPSFR